VAAANLPRGLTDTGILIDAARGLEAARAFLAQQQAVGLRSSIITAMELVRGCRNARELAQVQRFLQAVTVLPVTDAVTRPY
jgi:predicted nucleic acid-binding protein